MTMHLSPFDDGHVRLGRAAELIARERDDATADDRAEPCPNGPGLPTCPDLTVGAIGAMYDDMTRAEAIAAINAKLSSLDDDGVLAVAGIVEDIAEVDEVPRALTARELALIEQSKEDFKAGRVVSQEDYRVEMEAFLSQRRAKLPKSA